MVVIDPPFITKDVWEQYAKTAKALLKHSPFKYREEPVPEERIEVGEREQEREQEQEQKEDNHSQGIKKKCNPEQKHQGLVLATTVAENQSLMEELFNAKPTIFKPNIPKLVYQYNVFINCIDECNILKEKNPEIRVED
jgi:hypothetical protein